MIVFFSKGRGEFQTKQKLLFSLYMDLSVGHIERKTTHGWSKITSNLISLRR